MFQSLRWRLLLSYLTVVAAILGASAVAIYVSFRRSFDQQLNEQLLTLAEAAVPNLDSQLLTLDEVAVPSEVAMPKVGVIDAQGLQSLNQESPWRDLVQPNRGLEWFNIDGKLLAKEGTIFSALPLEKGSQVIRQQGKIRSLTISVSADGPNQKTPQLKGYIRASTSTQEVDVVMNRLSLGLSLGGVMALILSAIGGMRLTQRTLEPIEQSFEQLKQFTADASHELRSPLTAIKTSIDVILSHPERIHPLNSKKLVAIASATEQMTHLTEDLLFLTQIDPALLLPTTDPGMVPPAFEQVPVLLDKVLQDLVEQLEPQAQAKEITFKSHLLADVSIVGSATQLTYLFSNLLENALQYTPARGSVVLSMVRRDRFVTVSVEDTGLGIAPEHLPFIFQRFWRADEARSQRVEGLGLGLTIAQTIARRHGGEITASSEVGVGSCFQVNLPMV